MKPRQPEVRLMLHRRPAQLSEKGQKGEKNGLLRRSTATIWKSRTSTEDPQDGYLGTHVPAVPSPFSVPPQNLPAINPLGAKSPNLYFKSAASSSESPQQRVKDAWNSAWKKPVTSSSTDSLHRLSNRHFSLQSYLLLPPFLPSRRLSPLLRLWHPWIPATFFPQVPWDFCNLSFPPHAWLWGNLLHSPAKRMGNRHLPPRCGRLPRKAAGSPSWSDSPWRRSRSCRLAEKGRWRAIGASAVGWALF